MLGGGLMMVAAGADKWEFIGSVAGPGDGTASLTSLSLQEGDLVVVGYASDLEEASTPSGWTALIKITNRSHSWHGYKVMGATPDSSIDLGGGQGGVAVQAWRGVDTTSPYVNGIADSDSFGMPNPPSYTVANDNALVIIFGGLDDDAIASSVTAPSGYSNIIASDADDLATAMLASRIKETSGSENPASFGGTGNDEWVASTAEFLKG